MVPFTQKDVENIADLTRIDLQDDFGQSIANDLSQIVKMVGEISKIQTQDIEPMAHPLKNTQAPLRSDEVTEPNNRETLLNNAPSTEAGLILVPQVIEEG